MIKIKFGHSNEVNKSADVFTTVGAILRNASLRTALGFGDNVEAHVNGAAVNNSYALRSGDIVELVTKANSKG
jgi:translation initiation factor IF-1